MRSKRNGRRFDADADIVFLVLMGIDRVVTDGPEDATDVEQQCWPGERASDGSPADQSPPVEIEAEKHLRPIRDALHERIGGDQYKDSGPEQDRSAVEAEQNRRPEGQLQQQK